METKIFEIVDRSTFIPALAVRLKMDAAGVMDPEFYLMRRAGYSAESITTGEFVLLSTLTGGVGRACCDPYDWGTRTLIVAHDYIAKNWDTLKAGQVIDVEFISGETSAPKAPDMERSKTQAEDLTRPGDDVRGPQVGVQLCDTGL